MTFQLREGMFCRDAKGQKVGPMYCGYGGFWSYPGCEYDFHEDGKCVSSGRFPDLISEWQDDTPAADEWSEWMTDRDAREYIGGLITSGDYRMQVIGGVNLWSIPVSRKAVKREMVSVYGKDRRWVDDKEGPIVGMDTHRITFETVNGVPDCGTIKMEEL